MLYFTKGKEMARVGSRLEIAIRDGDLNVAISAITKCENEK